MSLLQQIAKILKDRFPNLSVGETIEISEKILDAVHKVYGI